MCQLQNPAHYDNILLFNKMKLERSQSLREKWIMQMPVLTYTERAENVFGVASADKDQD